MAMVQPEKLGSVLKGQAKRQINSTKAEHAGRIRRNRRDASIFEANLDAQGKVEEGLNNSGLRSI